MWLVWVVLWLGVECYQWRVLWTGHECVVAGVLLVSGWQLSSVVYGVVMVTADQC